MLLRLIFMIQMLLLGLSPAAVNAEVVKLVCKLTTNGTVRFALDTTRNVALKGVWEGDPPYTQSVRLKRTETTLEWAEPDPLQDGKKRLKFNLDRSTLELKIIRYTDRLGGIPAGDVLQASGLCARDENQI
jgi:hypothetical protein